MSEFTETETIDIEAMDESIDQELQVNLTLAIQTNILQKLVGQVESSVAKKTVQDIQKMIYMDIQQDEIIMRGMNNEYLTEVMIERNEDSNNFKITEGNTGSVCFPADKLVPIVKRLGHKLTSLKIEGKMAIFKSGRSTFDLHVVDGSLFPQPPRLSASKATIHIHPAVLNSMYDKTIYAASTSEMKPLLTGVNHRLVGDRLICVATDSHRLGQYVYGLDENPNSDISVVIPAKVIAEAKRHLGATEVEVEVHFYDNQVVYAFQNVTIYGRLIEGNYPDTDRLIFPTEGAGTSFTVHAGSFKTLLNNSTVYNPDQPIIIRIKPELGQLRVNTREAEVGAFQEDLVVTDGVGADVAVAVNVRYLQEALSKYNADDYISFSFMPSDEKKPTGMKPFKGQLKNGNEDCLELFVPVRTDQIDYQAEVVIEDFKGIPEFEFNPFESDFAEVE